MEAKLKIAELDCYKRTFYEKMKKEESRDAVVPDTMPDIAEVLCCWGGLLIRSKDLSAGRIRVEANVPAGVLCRAEDGSLRLVEVSVPFFLSAEGENIAEGNTATASLKLLSLEARTLNPRKLLVRGEIAAEISAFEAGNISYTHAVEGEEHIHAHVKDWDASLVTAVTEKTFAISDELSMPPGAEGVKEVFCAETDCVVDDVKSVGTKLIVKGRMKSRLVMLPPGGGICHLEPVTEFSQIIELGQEQEEGLHNVWIMPSGSYCSISGEFEGRIGLEYHLVAQLVCHGGRRLSLMDDAYSNFYELNAEYAQPELENVRDCGCVRDNLRHIFETLRPVSEVLYCGCSRGQPVFEGEKMLLPITVSAICSDGENIWCEKRGIEMDFRIPGCEGEPQLAGAEITELNLLPAPEGLELRLEARAELWNRVSLKPSCISALSYDEEKARSNIDRPSIVLLRLKPGDDLWNIARENCSSVEAILSANGDGAETVGRLILIPKTN